MTSHYLRIFTQPKAAILLLLGFSSGLPLTLTAGTLQAWITVSGVSITTIGFFSLVGQAYVFKFFWAPLMDRYAPPFLGRRRGWLLISQLLLMAGIIGMGVLDPAHDLTLLAALAVLVAFCSATQDIAFDAWKTDILPADERGNGAALSVLGYRLALLVSGGLALWLADHYLGWHKTYWLMALLLIPSMLATLWASEPSDIGRPRSMEDAIIAPLRDFFSRNNAWLTLSLIILYKLGDAFAASLTTTFLINALGFSVSDLALVNKSLGLLATLIGALLGGILMQRLSLFRALMLFGLLQAVSNLAYWFLAVTDKHLLTMAAAVFTENLCAGMGTAAFVALLMTLCNKSFSATQFALLSALSAVGRVYVGPVAGLLVKAWGWPALYSFSVVAAIPGLLLLIASKRTLEYTQKTGAFLPRTLWPERYRQALSVFIGGSGLLVLWLILLFTGWLRGTRFYYEPHVFQAGLWLLFIGIVWGTILDCLAVRRTNQTPSSS